MAAHTSIRTVFMGTPDFAVTVFQGLLGIREAAGRPLEVVGVFTQPDRPAGRGQKLALPAVKRAAQEVGVPVFQPERLRRPDALASLEALAPDLIVVAAYAQILSQRVLDLPPYGCLNVHASLLPRYRGAAPIQAAIRDGAAESGITIMLMDAGLDTGPILSKVAVQLDPAETAGSLAAKLSEAGARLLADTVPRWIAGELQPMPQDDAWATLTRPMRKEDERIDWSQPAVTIERQIRALQPSPGAFTLLGQDALKVLVASVLPRPHEGAPPGTLLPSSEGPTVATGQGLLLLRTVQPAGKRPMPAVDWLRGARLSEGTVLGNG